MMASALRTSHARLEPKFARTGEFVVHRLGKHSVAHFCVINTEIEINDWCVRSLKKPS
jgi:hypothetical protein